MSLCRSVARMRRHLPPVVKFVLHFTELRPRLTTDCPPKRKSRDTVSVLHPVPAP